MQRGILEGKRDPMPGGFSVRLSVGGVASATASYIVRPALA
jgi:hypothetical protein